MPADVVSLDAYRDERGIPRRRAHARVSNGCVVLSFEGLRASLEADELILTPDAARTWAAGLLLLADSAEREASEP